MGLTYQAMGVIIFALSVLYGATVLFTFIRARQAYWRYLHELPPVEGVPLDKHWVAGAGSVRRALFGVLRKPQSDPALEDLRREAQRRGRIHVVWGIIAFFVWFGLVLLVFSIPLTH